MAITLQDIIDLAGANTEYTATMTTNEIYFCANTDERFTDTLAMIASAILAKAEINHTHTGFSLVDHVHTEYADADHTHTEYAASAHTHTPASIGAASSDHTHTGYAASNHTHDYADSAHTHTPASIGAATADHSHSGYASANHTHTGFAASSHTHGVDDVTGLQTALNGKETSGAAASALNDAKSYTDNAIAGLINSAPSTLDTLGEIAAAMEDNADVVEALETAIGTKANASHTHTPASIGAAASDHTHTAASVGAAASNHTHTPAAIGAAAASHGHSYNDLSDKPTIPAAYTHPSTHPASMITGLADVATSGSYNDLTNKPTIPTIPSALPANGGNADTVDGKHASDFAAASHTHNYAASGHNHDTAYIAKALQFVNDSGAVEQSVYTSSNTSLITVLEALSIGFHTLYTQTGVEGNPNATEAFRLLVHKTNSNILWALAFGASGVVYNNYWNGGTWRGWKMLYNTGNLPTAADIGAAAASHTHTPASIGAAAASHTHDYAASGHNHDTDYSAKALQITSDTGSFKYSYKTTDNVNVLDAIKALPAGVFTVYSQGGVSGNPKTTEAWRMIAHKTGNTVLWVKAFGSSGSEYSNYCADGVWQGWRRIYDYAPEPLWTGERYMADTHTVTPSKALSQCANGWLLLWSDYNPGEGLQNVDFTTTYIPKRAYNGAVWDGHQFLCTVPKHSDTSGDGIIIKTLHISDTKIVGNSLNSTSPRNDVVLRAVYEF